MAVPVSLERPGYPGCKLSWTSSEVPVSSNERPNNHDAVNLLVGLNIRLILADINYY